MPCQGYSWESGRQTNASEKAWLSKEQDLWNELISSNHMLCYDKLTMEQRSESVYVETQFAHFSMMYKDWERNI